MPTYPIACKCGFRGDVFARMSEVDPDGCLPCPRCRAQAPQEYGEKKIRDTNTVFAGRQEWSVTEGWNPKTAREAIQMMGPEGNCIDPTTGRVRFRDRAEQQRYVRKLDQLQKRGQQLYQRKQAAKRAKAENSTNQ